MPLTAVCTHGYAIWTGIVLCDPWGMDKASFAVLGSRRNTSPGAPIPTGPAMAAHGPASFPTRFTCKVSCCWWWSLSVCSAFGVGSAAMEVLEILSAEEEMLSCYPTEVRTHHHRVNNNNRSLSSSEFNPLGNVWPHCAMCNAQGSHCSNEFNLPWPGAMGHCPLLRLPAL